MIQGEQFINHFCQKVKILHLLSKKDPNLKKVDYMKIGIYEEKDKEDQENEKEEKETKKKKKMKKKNKINDKRKKNKREWGKMKY